MGSVQSKSTAVLGSTSSISQSFGRCGSFLEYDRVIHHLQRGDLIEVLRGRYRHWVIFETVIGEHVMCFHITAIGDHPMDAIGGDIQPFNGIRKEISFNGKAVLKYEPLEDILRDTDSLEPSLCRINNQERMGRKMLKMAANETPNMDLVFGILHGLKDTLLKYCLKSMNCEHYATFWKYGIGWSSQVNSFKDIISAALKTVSTLAKDAAEILQHNGCYKMGLVCLLVAAITSSAAQVVDGIDFTLKNLCIQDLIKHAVAY